MITMIPVADACDFDKEVDDYCCENDFSTHYSSEIYQLELDGNPLQKFFESAGHVFSDEGTWAYIGIFGT